MNWVIREQVHLLQFRTWSTHGGKWSKPVYTKRQCSPAPNQDIQKLGRKVSSHFIIMLILSRDFIHAQHCGRTTLDVADPLRDGLLVTGGEAIRRHVTHLTLLVMLDVHVQ